MEFSAKYAPTTEVIDEKTRITLSNEGYALTEAIYALIESLNALRNKL